MSSKFMFMCLQKSLRKMQDMSPKIRGTEMYSHGFLEILCPKFVFCLTDFWRYLINICLQKSVRSLIGHCFHGFHGFSETYPNFLPDHVSTHLKMWDFPERLWKFSPGETNEPWPYPNQRAKHLHSLTTTTSDVMAARCLLNSSMTFLLILLCHIRTSWGV